nr:immunoglobulin heavy chain junction region [Macaca mulatta]
CAKKEDSLHVW